MPLPFYIFTLGGYLLPKNVFNFENHGYNPAWTFWLFSKGAWTYWYSDQMASTVFLLLFVAYFFVSSEKEDGSNLSPRGILGYNIIVPALLYTLHRFAVSVKFATMSRTELERFALADYKQALIYQQHMQLLSSWTSRSTTLLDFEIEAASIRARLPVRQVSFVVENPDNSPEALTNFKNWQALLTITHDVSNFTNDVPEDLRDILIKDKAGTNYEVQIEIVAKAVIRWVDQMGEDQYVKKYERFQSICMLILGGSPFLFFLLNIYNDTIKVISLITIPLH